MTTSIPPYWCILSLPGTMQPSISCTIVLEEYRIFDFKDVEASPGVKVPTIGICNSNDEKVRHSGSLDLLLFQNEMRWFRVVPPP
jgi:hypothetical protein